MGLRKKNPKSSHKATTIILTVTVIFSGVETKSAHERFDFARVRRKIATFPHIYIPTSRHQPKQSEEVFIGLSSDTPSRPLSLPPQGSTL